MYFRMNFLNDKIEFHVNLVMQSKHAVSMIHAGHISKKFNNKRIELEKQQTGY